MKISLKSVNISRIRLKYKHYFKKKDMLKILFRQEKQDTPAHSVVSAGKYLIFLLIIERHSCTYYANLTHYYCYSRRIDNGKKERKTAEEN